MRIYRLALTVMAALILGGAPTLSAQVATTPTEPTSAVSGLPVDQALDLARGAIDRLVASRDPDVRASAEQDLDRGLAIVKTNAPDHPWLPYLYAFVSIRQGQSWDAVDQLRTFVRTRDGRTEWKAYRTLGDLVVEEFPRLARSHFDKAASLIDGEPTVLYGLSRCAANVGDYAEALEYAKQTVTADRRRSTKYLDHLARIARFQKDWATAGAAGNDALTLVKQEANIRPGERDPLMRVNAQYKLLIENETARLADVRDPVEVSSGFVRLADYARERAKVVALLSKHEVVGVLDAGLERLGEDASIELLEQTVVAYYDIGRDQDAIALCRRILDKNPDNAVGREWLARFGEPVDEGEDHGGDSPPPLPRGD